MKVLVVYDTRFGNTERIAKSLERGLRQVAGIETRTSINIKEISTAAPTTSHLMEYDMICVGAPTEGFTASKQMKEFLDKLKSANFLGKYGFAFDTKIDSRLSGSAAKQIEKIMVKQGFKIIAPRESAIVSAIKANGAISGATLREGEDKRFEQAGERIGKILTSTRRTVSSA